jgi:hypothetical protein
MSRPGLASGLFYFRMATLRKYWFISLLLGTLIASVLSLLEPSTEKTFALIVVTVWIVALVTHIFHRIEKIERRLDEMQSERSETKR